jgi:phosphopantetheinyl transferase
MTALVLEPPEPLWVDLWLFDLDQQGERLLEIGQSAQLLVGSEIERSSRLASAALAKSFLASRTALRLVLLEHGCDGRREFDLGPDGKPLPRSVHFNLSRASNAVIIAVSNAEVGVDIERRRPVAIAEPVVVEVCSLLRRTGWLAEVEHHATRAWTVMEAWVKYHGYSMLRLFDEKELASRLLSDILSDSFDLTPLALPPHLYGTVCAGKGTRLTYGCSSRITS